jgi:hypothetical protein
MNSATEGKILDDATVFSKGTDTSLDSPQQEDKIINVTRFTNASNNEDEVIVSALHTEILTNNCPCQNICGLCRSDVDLDDDIEEEAEIATSLKTNASRDPLTAVEEEQC